MTLFIFFYFSKLGCVWYVSPNGLARVVRWICDFSLVTGVTKNSARTPGDLNFKSHKKIGNKIFHFPPQKPANTIERSYYELTQKAAAGTLTQTVTCPLIPERVRSYTLDRSSHSGWTLQTCLVGWFWNAVPTVKNKRVKAAFSAYASQLRSKLPEDLRLETGLTTFKSKLKT